MRKPILFAILVALAAPAAAEPSLEDTVTEHQKFADRARDLARQHFQALAAGDKKALAKLWAPTAEVTSRNGDQTTVTPIKRALRRWLAAREGLTWQMESSGVLADGRIWVTATVTWNKSRFHDTLLLERTEEGFRFSGKISTAVSESEQMGY